MNKKRALRSLFILVAATLVSGLIAYAQITTYKSGTPQKGNIAGMNIGGSFALHDQKGALFTEKDLAGKITLLYFGFTYCPAICPTELQKMNVATKKIGPESEKIQQVFITLDPDRDTRKVMAAYVPQFNDRLIGLTGTQADIDKALKAYHVYARKVQTPEMTDYTMDHSSYIYLIGPAGDVLSLYGADSTSADLVAEITAALKS